MLTSFRTIAHTIAPTPAVQTSVISRDRANVTMPGTAISVSLACFQLLIEVHNGQKPEINLICQFFISGRRSQVRVSATIEAIVPKMKSVSIFNLRLCARERVGIKAV